MAAGKTKICYTDDPEWYLEPYQISEMEFFLKIVTKNRSLFSQKIPS